MNVILVQLFLIELAPEKWLFFCLYLTRFNNSTHDFSLDCRKASDHSSVNCWSVFCFVFHLMRDLCATGQSVEPANTQVYANTAGTRGLHPGDVRTLLWGVFFHGERPLLVT